MRSSAPEAVCASVSQRAKTCACRCPAPGLAGLVDSFPGVPDVGLTTATEVAENIPEMREATTVRLFERAAANMLQLEDRVYSRHCGHLEGKQVRSA